MLRKEQLKDQVSDTIEKMNPIKQAVVIGQVLNKLRNSNSPEKFQSTKPK